MRILRVVARAFGPFRNETLEFEHGMNVVCGPNEAGKSSWHAALFAGLCGLRRGRGRRADDKSFEERHRPWSGDDWSVEIDLELASGRRVQILQDLDGKIDSRAIDRLTGRDVTGEILNEGMPDGSMFLGLNRSILTQTICICQADVLSVLRDSGELQGQLQRAAAAGGAGEPAEAAIRRITAFQSEQVGRAHVNARKPLRIALNELEAAGAALAAAQQAHAAYLALLERRAVAESQARDAERAFRAVERAIASRKLEELEQRVDRARSLHARFPQGQPPQPALELERLARIQEALTLFDHRPEEPRSLAGSSAAEIEAEIRALPQDLDEPQQPVLESRGRVGDPPAPPIRLAPKLLFRGAAGLTVAGVLLAAWTGGIPRISGLGLAGMGLALLLEAARRSSRERQAAASVERRQLVERLALQQRSAAAARKRQLQHELRARQEAEAARERAVALRRRYAEQVRQVAGAAGIASGVEDAERVVEQLRGFKARLEQRIEEDRMKRDEWVTLQEILAGRSLEELETELRRRQGEGVPEWTDLPVIAAGADLDRLLREARRSFEASQARLQHLNGEAAALERGLPDVAGAEEAVERAGDELCRVESLKATLERTLRFLIEARDRVQRDIAPALTASVERRLARITNDRYREAAVDPADLTVRVRPPNGVWREAGLLSHGTMEQIYLLLRLGLAEHLPARGEPAPLFLDEVTVQADAARTVAVLELLHEISRERQVIAFSQEQEVTSWAAARLPGPPDKLIRLEAR